MREYAARGFSPKFIMDVAVPARANLDGAVKISFDRRGKERAKREGNGRSVPLSRRAALELFLS
ncbi:hypothetical protein B5V00_05955 [Geothermobacter hydrogeniphilus]|uniref:Uncharacterized protein n=1 Tax=Geothermobacter hydrogeniphilus TaxID=1969733 RepID=A0A1X0Y8Q8_9BACT|nr:hypothetical protein B5V00_05955 [Geothermobacter hydrogeniphilus]